MAALVTKFPTRSWVSNPVQLAPLRSPIKNAFFFGLSKRFLSSHNFRRLNCFFAFQLHSSSLSFCSRIWNVVPPFFRDLFLNPFSLFFCPTSRAPIASQHLLARSWLLMPLMVVPSPLFLGDVFPVIVAPTNFQRESVFLIFYGSVSFPRPFDVCFFYRQSLLIPPFARLFR